MRETPLMQEIRAALNVQPGVRLWRNNCGMLRAPNGTPVRFGLAVGSCDLVGVLAPMGRLICFEVKTATGRVSKEQKAWLRVVHEHGGFACVVRSVEDALAALDRARMGGSE